MGTKYSSNSASGYNSTPPADDGTVSEANKVKYSTIKTKLADPSKDLADTINTDLVTHFDNGPNAYTTNQTLGATHYNQVNQVSGSGVTLTLSDASALTAGWYTEIISTDTTNNVTLARATASNTINETSADVTILPLQHLRVVVNAAANGFLVSTQGRHSKEYKSAENRTVSGTITMSGKSLWFAEGADVASAADCNIWTTDGNTVHVTGTTTISDWGTAPQAGAMKLVIFDGALQLTYDATTNKLNTNGANYTTTAGDRALVYAESTTSYVVSIIPLDGEAVVINRGLTKLNSGTVSAAATLDIAMTAYTAYKNKLLVFESFIPATNNVILYLRVSTDGGSTYDSGAGAYRYAITGLRDDNVSNNTNSASATEMIVSGNGSVVNAAGYGISGEITMFDTTNTGMSPRFRVESVYNNSGGWCHAYGVGARQNTQDTDAVRLFFSSGNISSGTWTLYGYN